MYASIVVEGTDNSGKSTLAAKIGDRYMMPVQEGEGPPRPGETMDDRIRKYLKREGDWVFGRHPVVSQQMYNGVGSNTQTVDKLLEAEFYRRRPILIYCDPKDRGLGEHKPRTGEKGNEHIDTPEFLADLEKKYNTILGKYHVWAARNAELSWRIGDDESEFFYLLDNLLRYRRLNVWLTQARND